MDDRKITRTLPPLTKVSKSETISETKPKRSRKKSQKIRIVESNQENVENDQITKGKQRDIFSISSTIQDFDKNGESGLEVSNEEQTRQLPIKPKRNKKHRTNHNLTEETIDRLSETADNSIRNNREQRANICSESSSKTDENPKERSSSIVLSGDYPQQIQSQSVGKLFVEHKNKFISVDQSEVVEDTNKSQSYLPPSQLALDVAINNQKYFCIIGTFCCGLLAGTGLWQCIIPYLSDTSENDVHDFLLHLKKWILPFQSLFFSLSVISTVFAFDRYDFFHLQWNTVKKLLVCQNGLIIIIIYPVTLILSLSMVHIDNKISLYETNSSLWVSMSHEEKVNEVIYWRNMNTARCTGAILGWIIIAILPKTDYFGEFLKKIREEDDNIPNITDQQWRSV